MQLFAQWPLIWLERAQTFPIGGAFDGSLLNAGRFVRLARGAHLDPPSFDVIAGTGVHLHVIPVVASKVLDHRLGQGLGIPFPYKIVSPHACRYTVYRPAAQRGINTLLLIHSISFPSKIGPWSRYVHT